MQTWSINIRELPQKDQKMFVEEAKELLKKYQQELVKINVDRENREHIMHSYMKDWVEAKQKAWDLQLKISCLESRIESDEEEEDDE